MREKLKMC